MRYRSNISGHRSVGVFAGDYSGGGASWPRLSQAAEGPPPARLRAFRAAAFWDLNRSALLMRHGMSICANCERSTSQRVSAWCDTSVQSALHAVFVTLSRSAKELSCKRVLVAASRPHTRSLRKP